MIWTRKGRGVAWGSVSKGGNHYTIRRYATVLQRSFQNLKNGSIDVHNEIVYQSRFM